MGQNTSDNRRSQFSERYEEQKDKIFCNKQDLLAYCMDHGRHSVHLGLFFKLINMDPLWQAITISPICHKVFRKMFLEQDIVGIIPRARYRIGDHLSVDALQWLAYIS